MIQSIIDALTSNPGQFHFEISIIGTAATATGGGIGLSVNVTGGAPGSSTVGFNSQAGGANIQIAQKAADEKIQQEMAWLINQLQIVSDEIKSKTPNHDNLRKIYQSLLNTWVPGVIVSVIGNIVTLALGIKL